MSLRSYEYSSASFYEKEIKKYENLVHINDALNNLIPGSPSHKARCEDPGLTSKIIKRLQEKKANNLLDTLHAGVKKKRK
jgi:hypothetical protein